LIPILFIYLKFEKSVNIFLILCLRKLKDCSGARCIRAFLSKYRKRKLFTACKKNKLIASNRGRQLNITFYRYTRLSSRAHLLFQLWTCSLCIQFKNKNKNFFCGFRKFSKIEFCLEKFLKIRSFVNIPWGPARSYTQFGPDRFSRFGVYRIQTADRQTPPRQAKYIYRFKTKYFFFRKTKFQ